MDFDGCVDDLDLFDLLPTRSVVDQNTDNLAWQSTALSAASLRELYAAKCRDLDIERDAHQYQKFCQHIISTAKNRRLSLSNCFFKEDSAGVIARYFMMCNHQVASYDLSHNELDDRGVATIAEALYRT